MKFLVIVLLSTVALVSAVKPRVNSRFSPRFQRQEAAPAAGEVPHTVYGPPPQNPPQEYGPPPEEATTQSQDNNTTTEIPTTTEALSESVNATKPNSRLTKGQEKGVYYIYHPNGQLQKVAFATKKDARTMALTAQLKYENVEPINGPIFTYDPQTLILTPYRQ